MLMRILSKQKHYTENKIYNFIYICLLRELQAIKIRRTETRVHGSTAF